MLCYPANSRSIGTRILVRSYLLFGTDHPIAATMHQPVRLRRTTLFSLQAFVALTAIPGGIVLMASPDGSAIGLTLELLAASPFTSYSIPGIFLALVVGGTAVLGSVLVYRAHPAERVASLATGSVLMGWIVAQCFFLQAIIPLHLLFFALGLSIAVLAAVMDVGKTAASAEVAL
jgi:hypothetical protein